MQDLKAILRQFEHISRHPGEQLRNCLASGKKAIGCTPYYVPEELVDAAGMVPFSLWGRKGTPQKARQYFASFYCSLAQMNMEMALEGTLDGLSAVIFTVLCDTLRPASQNFKVGVKNLPMIFLAHPQNRRTGCGIEYCRQQYTRIRSELESIAGRPIRDEDITRSIVLYNENRRERRRFSELCSRKPGLVSAVERNHVFRAAGFMRKEEHTALLQQLNDALEHAAAPEFKGQRIVTSGILLDNENLLALLDRYQLAIVADDVAQESRGIREDVAESGDPLAALAKQFGKQNQDPLLYDQTLYSRPAYVVNLLRKNQAKGLICAMMSFCDPEELEYPDLKKALEKAGYPLLKIGYNHEMTDFGQADTSLQAFADILAAQED